MLNNDAAIEMLDNKLKDIDSKTGLVVALDQENVNEGIWVSPEDSDISIFLDFRLFNKNGNLTFSIVSEMVEGGGQPFHLSFTFNHADLQHQIYIPVQYLLKSWSPKNSYSLYAHIINEKVYYGITKRHWLDDRWEEHVYDARNGKKRLLWEAMNGEKSDLICHVLMGTGYSKDEAMHLEEFWVDQWGLHPLGLNLIPGGYAGHRFLRENNLLGRNFSECDIKFICDQSELRSQASKDLWLSDEYAERVICSGAKRLNAGQVRKIRALFKAGLNSSRIVDEVGALNARQVQGVISGETYTRIQ